jgi:hypothetical protein
MASIIGFRDQTVLPSFIYFVGAQNKYGSLRLFMCLIFCYLYYFHCDLYVSVGVTGV